MRLITDIRTSGPQQKFNWMESSASARSTNRNKSRRPDYRTTRYLTSGSGGRAVAIRRKLLAELCQPFPFQFLCRKGLLLRLSTVRSSVMGGSVWKLHIGHGPSFGGLPSLLSSADPRPLNAKSLSIVSLSIPSSRSTPIASRARSRASCFTVSLLLSSCAFSSLISSIADFCILGPLQWGQTDTLYSKHVYGTTEDRFGAMLIRSRERIPDLVSLACIALGWRPMDVIAQPWRALSASSIHRTLPPLPSVGLSVMNSPLATALVGRKRTQTQTQTLGSSTRFSGQHSKWERRDPDPRPTWSFSCAIAPRSFGSAHQRMVHKQNGKVAMMCHGCCGAARFIVDCDTAGTRPSPVAHGTLAIRFDCCLDCCHEQTEESADRASRQ